MKDIRHHLHCYNAEQSAVVIQEHGFDDAEISAVYGAINDQWIADSTNRDVVHIIFFKDGQVMTTDAVWLTEGRVVYHTIEEMAAEITIHKAVQVW